MACKGCGGPCPPCPQSVFVNQLDPDCPVAVPLDSGFVDILSRVVAVPAGLPSFGVDIVADLVSLAGIGGTAQLTVQLVDVFEGTETVIRELTVSTAASTSESIAIIGGLNNLSAGNHTIVLRADSSAFPVTVTSAGMRTALNQLVTFDVSVDCPPEVG